MTSVEAACCVEVIFSNKSEKHFLDKTSVSANEVFHNVERNMLCVNCWVSKSHIYNWVPSLLDYLKFGVLILLKFELLEYFERKFKGCFSREESDNFFYKLFLNSQDLNDILSILLPFLAKLFQHR